MSSQLPPIDLTGAVVGTQKILDFNQFVKFNPLHQAQHAILACFNESGCGLQLKLKNSNHEQFLPAGGWTTFDIEATDSNMVITVLYTLPTPPVSSFIAIYYAPGETPPQPYTLGNSPIGIGGSVQTSSVQTLSNEGGAANVLVEDIGDAALAQLVTIYSDGHALWKVDQTGVAHQVLKINTAGNPLQLGQAGDISEVLGSLTVDQGMVLNVAPIVVNGTTSGTATLYQLLQGTIKYTVLDFNNFQSTIKTILLPVAYVRRATVTADNIPDTQFMKASVAQNIDVLTGLAAAGGSITTQTTLHKRSIGFLQNSGFDTLSFLAGAAGDGQLIITGV